MKIELQRDDFVKYINSWSSIHNLFTGGNYFPDDDLYNILIIFLNQHFNEVQIKIIEDFLFTYNYIISGSNKDFEIGTYSLGLTNRKDNYKIKNLEELYNYL